MCCRYCCNVAFNIVEVFLKVFCQGNPLCVISVSHSLSSHWQFKERMNHLMSNGHRFIPVNWTSLTGACCGIKQNSSSTSSLKCPSLLPLLGVMLNQYKKELSNISYVTMYLYQMFKRLI